MQYIATHILRTHSKKEFNTISSFDWQLLLITATLIHIDDQYTFFEKTKLEKTFETFFQPHQRSLALEAIDKIDTKNVSWRLLLADFIKETNPEDRSYVITFLFELACADCNFKDEELDFIHKLSVAFHMPEIEFMKTLTKYRLWNTTFRQKELNKLKTSTNNTQYKDIKKALAILKLPENSNFIEIKKRYRDLMKKHHPDTHKAKLKEEIAYHKEQVYRISKAYKVLFASLHGR